MSQWNSSAKARARAWMLAGAAALKPMRNPERGRGAIKINRLAKGAREVRENTIQIRPKT